MLSNVLGLSTDPFIFDQAGWDHLGPECHAQVHTRRAIAGLLVPQNDRRRLELEDTIQHLCGQGRVGGASSIGKRMETKEEVALRVGFFGARGWTHD